MINIYTDGSCIDMNGGWAYVLEFKGKKNRPYRKIGADHQSDTTNNRMELTAVIEALGAVLDVTMPTTVYTDSQYVMVAHQNRDQWQVNYLTAARKPLKNIDLLKILYKQINRFNNIRFQKVPAHAGNEWNEYADELAYFAASFKSKAI